MVPALGLGSGALVADARETWVCSYLSLSLLIGVGAYALLGWWWADSIGALAMLPVIVWQGWETFAEARNTSKPAVAHHMFGVDAAEHSEALPD
jgi:divalent metal cation (Fe/Co/Zn/Cd) transporter